MDAHRFDTVTRWFATRRFTRRTALAGATVAALRLTSASAQDASPVADATPAAPEPVSLLFVQQAGATTLEPGTGTLHTLTMTEVRAQTLYFADRPSRITGATPTDMFVASFSEIFGDDPPNASLIGHLESGGAEEEAVVLTLLSATYDEATMTLTYTVELLDAELLGNRTFEQEPLVDLGEGRNYAESHLFIDSATREICRPEEGLGDCTTNQKFYRDRFQSCVSRDSFDGMSPSQIQPMCASCLEWMGCIGPIDTETVCETVDYECVHLPGYDS